MDFRQRRLRILAFARSETAERYFQWRQPDSNLFRGSSGDGGLGCAAACGQYLVRLWTGKHVTMNDFGKAGGYPELWQRVFRRGMTSAQVVKALRHYGVKYKSSFNMTPLQVMRMLRRRGPVLVAHTYGWYPEWRGKRYGGVLADGRPNGFARPRGKAGKTQLTGFENGRHAALALAKYHRAGTPTGATDVYMWDPNHGSPVRPERPDYDIMTLTQFSALMRSGQIQVVYPTAVWKGTPR